MMKWNGLNRTIEKSVKKVVHQVLGPLLILLIGGGCSVHSIDQGAAADTFTRQLDVQIMSLMDKYDIPGTAIALVKNGELIWSNAYGYADIEQQKKLTIDAVCRTESISKSVTAWGVKKLVERDLINLDDPVRKYLHSWSLPESEYNLDEITIRRLLSNSAGIPLGSLGEEYSPEEEKPSLRQYLRKEVQLTYEPGSNFEYSNPGFNLLELVIEEVTGRDFSEYMENEILRPLEMYNSSFDWDEEWSSKVPMGYDLQGNPVPPYVYPYKASGGLFSTVEDIARFAIAGMAQNNKLQPKVLNEESIQDIQNPQIKTSGIFSFVSDDYGFGHFIETLQDGKKAVWHGGQGHGWMTHFHFIPETGDGIVIFTNSQRSWPLIAQVLNDWSRWTDFGPVKFGRITKVVIGLKIIIGLILLVTLCRAGQIIYGIITGYRKLTITPSQAPIIRFTELVAGVAILAILIWSVSRDYLFITSVFPVGAIRLGWVLLFLSLTLLCSALLPVLCNDQLSNLNHERNENKRNLA